uniref:Uncharacterized protein n=1 Tax=Naja naja TaxID=35670 RepID=A0A8C6XGD3_NAJNA
MYFWTISYFSLSGEMSEKLSRCRKELAAAIDRAMEDLSIPFLPSQDASNNQDSDLPIVQLSTPPNVDTFHSKGEVISPTVYYSQPSSAVSSPEKENPLLRSNLFPVTVTSSIACTKREPLMSKENTWLHAPIFMADKQYLISLQDSERWKKGQVRYALLSQYNDVKRPLNKWHNHYITFENYHCIVHWYSIFISSLHHDHYSKSKPHVKKNPIQQVLVMIREWRQRLAWFVF